MKIPFDKEWILFEKEDYANYFFVYSTWEAYTWLPEKWGFENGRFMGAEFVNGACNLFMPLKYYDEMNRRNYRSLFTAPEKWQKLHKINNSASEKLFSFSKKLTRANPKKLSDKEIFKILEKFFALQNIVHVPRGPIWQMETPNNILNDYLHGYLEEKNQESGASIDIGLAFRILTTPTEESILTKERRELASIALMSNKIEQMSCLLKHVKKYEWLEYGLQGRILSIEHFQKELEALKTEHTKRFLEDKHSIIEKQQETISKLKIGKSHKKIFKIVRDSLFARLYSKFAQFHGYYVLEPILKEIGFRYGLSPEEVRYLSIKHLEKMLTGKIKKKIYWGPLARSHKVRSLQISERGETKVYVGTEADKMMRRIIWKERKIEAKQADDIKGQIAFIGKVKGRVKIVNTVQEIAKMHKGNILVSHMTNPDIVSAMKMAAAIITDLGGITCHAAIIARELEKPCIIGTKVATRVLKDGDFVEVDAERGIVKILKRA